MAARRRKRIQAYAVYETPNPVSNTTKTALLVGAGLAALGGIYLLTRPKSLPADQPPAFGGTGPEIINTLGPYGV